MGYDGADIRFYLIRQHHRSPLPFDLDLLGEAQKQRARINNFVSYEMAERSDGKEQPAIAAAVEEARVRFRAALEDDLNTAEALGVVHELMTTVNRIGPSRADAATVLAFMAEFDSVFDILDAPREEILDDQIERLIEERKAARAAGDFARADAIRDGLKEGGIELLDTADGTRWKRSGDSG